MKYVIGVDGCPAGWVAVGVQLNPRALLTAGIYPSIEQLWNELSDASRIWLDIPIGLAEDCGRSADKAARERLKPLRHNSVFSAPVRTLIDAPETMTYSEACALSRLKRGKAISQQAWAIVRKIRETDRLLRSDSLARQMIVESHPEVVLSVLNDGQPMANNKKKPAGRAERLAVLSRYIDDADRLLDDFFADHTRKECGVDDLIDALTLAVGASFTTWTTLPDEPELDVHSLPMRIAYPVIA